MRVHGEAWRCKWRFTLKPSLGPGALEHRALGQLVASLKLCANCYLMLEKECDGEWGIGWLRVCGERVQTCVELPLYVFFLLSFEWTGKVYTFKQTSICTFAFCVGKGFISLVYTSIRAFYTEQLKLSHCFASLSAFSTMSTSDLTNELFGKKLKIHLSRSKVKYFYLHIAFTRLKI